MVVWHHFGIKLHPCLTSCPVSGWQRQGGLIGKQKRRGSLRLPAAGIVGPHEGEAPDEKCW